MPKRKNRRKKKTPSKSAPLTQTMKNLDYLEDLLRCVICGKIPDTVYCTSKCSHKYCKGCVTKVEGKICLICDIKVEKTDVKIDEFSTGLTSRVTEFEHALGILNDEHENDGVLLITIE